jgi:hypothetical protein
MTRFSVGRISLSYLSGVEAPIPLRKLPPLAWCQNSLRNPIIVNKHQQPPMNQNIARSVLFAVGLVLFAVYLWAYCDARYRRSRANHLLSDVEELKVGTSTGDEIKRLSEKYAGRFRDLWPEPGYQMDVSSRYVNFRGQPYPLPGQRLWSVSAYLYVRDDRLRRVQVVAGIHRSDWHDLGVTILIDSDKETMPKDVSYYVRFSHGNFDSGQPPMEILELSLTPEADARQFVRAFDVNLSCLTAFFQCRNVCELQPSAWNDRPLEERMSSLDGYGKKIGTECQSAIGPQ